MLTSKWASRHNGVDFFNISTSKSAPSMVCFVRFLFRNVLTATTACTFSRSQLPKCSGNGVLCTFLLRNVLRATTACTFFTSQLPKVVRMWSAFYILTSTRALRHDGVQFFISHLATWLRTRRFSEPTLRAEPQIIGKTQCVATFLPFRALGSSFFWNFLFFDILSSSLLLSSLTLPIAAFHLSILWHCGKVMCCICIIEIYEIPWTTSTHNWL
jgi:hypothetical protein